MLATTMLIQSTILSVLIILVLPGDCCVARNLPYYVLPTSQVNGNTTLDYEEVSTYIMTLKEYQKLGNFSECDYKSNKNFPNITVIFLEGVHQARPDRALRFINVKGITFIGHGCSDQVIVKNLDLRIITGTVYIQSITMQGTSIIMYRSSSLNTIYRPITVVNCKLIGSKMILPNVQLTVESSEFHNSSSTAITLYSSFAIFCGKVIFVNNSGTKGGAIALIGSTLTIKSNTLLVFKNNHAHETGGAIYADNVEPRINLEGYRSYCFYMLEVNESSVLDTPTQVLNFENNTASLGGDHIYGAKLKSDCVSSSYCHDDNCRFSFETIANGDVFRFDPGFTIDTSWSAVSGDPTRLCLCDSSGLPQCTNASMIYFNEIQVYPGQPFVISTVLVGGDFGTTIGTAYAHIMMHGNPSASSRLGRPQEYAQLVQNNTECTKLSYSILSNRSSEILNLTATKITQGSLYHSIILDAAQLDDHIRNYIH